MTSWKETLPFFTRTSSSILFVKNSRFSPTSFRSSQFQLLFFRHFPTFHAQFHHSQRLLRFWILGSPHLPWPFLFSLLPPIRVTYLWFFLQTLLLFVSCWAYELLLFIYLFITVWLAKTFARDLLPPREPSPPSFQSISELWTKFWLSLHFSEYHHGT